MALALSEIRDRVNLLKIKLLGGIYSIVTVIILLPFLSNDTESFSDIIYVQILFDYWVFGTDNYLDSCVLIESK